jgi:mannonate dehydratase
VSTLASIHVDLATPNCVIQEMIEGPGWQADLFETEFTVVDGYALPPERPGLGLGFSEEEAAKHPYVPDFRPEWKWPDGMITDW